MIRWAIFMAIVVFPTPPMPHKDEMAAHLSVALKQVKYLSKLFLPADEITQFGQKLKPWAGHQGCGFSRALSFGRQRFVARVLRHLFHFLLTFRGEHPAKVIFEHSHDASHFFDVRIAYAFGFPAFNRRFANAGFLGECLDRQSPRISALPHFASINGDVASPVVEDVCHGDFVAIWWWLRGDLSWVCMRKACGFWAASSQLILTCR